MNKQGDSADTGKEINDLQAQAFELLLQLTDEQTISLLEQFK